MSILDKGSVLLLGAGASAPFGLPLGGELIQLVRTAINKEFTSDSYRTIIDANTLGYNVLREAFESPNYPARKFFEKPIAHTVARMIRSELEASSTDNPGSARRNNELMIQLKGAADQLRALGHLLNDQTAETVDAFIAENPGCSRLTKLCVGALMIKYSYQPEGDDALLRRFSGRESVRQVKDERGMDSPISERNWIHLLINIVRHALLSDPSFRPTIRVISFNYDVVLEMVLEKQWQNTERREELPHWRDVFEIVHVHGKFPDMHEKQDRTELAQLAVKCGEAITVVNERSAPEIVTADRDLAKRWIRDASTIYSAGFSFARPNCDLIGLSDLKTQHTLSPPIATKIVFTNFNGDVGVRLAANRLARGAGPAPIRVVETEEVNGTRERPVSITDFIKAGFLGDLPG